MAAFREWEQFVGHRFADLNAIQHSVLIVNGIHDEMIPVSSSYWLSTNLPNAILLTYPDSGHESLFQFHDSFTRQATAFLASDSPYAPYLVVATRATKGVSRESFAGRSALGLRMDSAKGYTHGCHSRQPLLDLQRRR
jgi:TAP-like protein